VTFKLDQACFKTATASGSAGYEKFTQATYVQHNHLCTQRLDYRCLVAAASRLMQSVCPLQYVTCMHYATHNICTPCTKPSKSAHIFSMQCFDYCTEAMLKNHPYCCTSADWPKNPHHLHQQQLPIEGGYGCLQD
jgi:hypothetical protein